VEPIIVVGIWNGGKGRHTEYLPQKPFVKLKETLLSSKRWQGSSSTKKTISEFVPESDNYLKFLVTELKPHIDQNYKTDKSKAGSFIAGSSMGGLISMYAICEYPDIFGGAACLSTHWPGLHITENNPIPGAFIDYLNHHLPDPANHTFYFDFGTETLDSLYEPYQIKVDGVMQLNGYTTENWMSKKFEGHDHSERSWNKRLDIPLQFLINNANKN